MVIGRHVDDQKKKKYKNVKMVWNEERIKGDLGEESSFAGSR